MALHVVVVAALTLSVHLPAWQRHARVRRRRFRPRWWIRACSTSASKPCAKSSSASSARKSSKREAEQKVQRERDETAKREQDLKIKQAQELKDKQAREQKARDDAAKREQEQKTKQAQELKDKQARDQKAREDAAKAAVTRKQQQQAEDDLQRQLAAEADRQQAERSGLLDQYVRMIQDKIERNWTRPLSARSGLDCMVSVVQLPTGRRDRSSTSLRATATTRSGARSKPP